MGGGATALPDTIKLTGISAIGHHGVLEQERITGQPFVVDVELATDIRKAAADDDLRLTVNYAEVAELVNALVTGEPCNLIETLAERIAGAVLAGFAVSAVTVTVHKPEAPIPVPFSDVAVTVFREAA